MLIVSKNDDGKSKNHVMNAMSTSKNYNECWSYHVMNAISISFIYHCLVYLLNYKVQNTACEL